MWSREVAANDHQGNKWGKIKPEANRGGHYETYRMYIWLAIHEMEDKFGHTINNK